jgi:hypothetical protein
MFLKALVLLTTKKQNLILVSSNPKGVYRNKYFVFQTYSFNAMYVSLRSHQQSRIPLRMSILNLLHEMMHSLGARHDLNEPGKNMCEDSLKECNHNLLQDNVFYLSNLGYYFWKSFILVGWHKLNTDWVFWVELSNIGIIEHGSKSFCK